MAIFSGSLPAKDLMHRAEPRTNVDGKMAAGFAFVAYPAEYRFSGAMTFIVNKSGAIYEKDLGPNKTEIAGAIVDFDPDSTWAKVD
jgi:Protein of unknown function (DUF2950)